MVDVTDFYTLIFEGQKISIIELVILTVAVLTCFVSITWLFLHQRILKTKALTQSISKSNVKHVVVSILVILLSIVPLTGVNFSHSQQEEEYYNLAVTYLTGVLNDQYSISFSETDVEILLKSGTTLISGDDRVSDYQNQPDLFELVKDDRFTESTYETNNIFVDSGFNQYKLRFINSTYIQVVDAVSGEIVSPKVS